MFLSVRLVGSTLELRPKQARPMQTPWISQGHVSPRTARLCGLEAFDTMSMPCSILTMVLLSCVLQAFANVEGLFDRLATYVRARLPQIRQIHEKIRDGVKIH